MEKIKDRLNEIIKEADFNKLSANLDMDVSIIYTWQRREYLPSTENYINLCKFFNVSMDFMLCRTEDYGSCVVNKINNFYNSLVKIAEMREVSFKKMRKDNILTSNNLFKWKHGSVPTPGTLIKLADYLGVSVDELLSAE